MFPSKLLHSTFVAENSGTLQARSEVERRGKYIALLNSHHPILVMLVKQCLQDNPRQRPSTEEVLARVQELRVEVEREFTGRLNDEKVKLSRKIFSRQRIPQVLESEVKLL